MALVYSASSGQDKQRFGEILEVGRLVEPRLVRLISAATPDWRTCSRVTRGAAVCAIDLQAKRGVAGALLRPVVGGLQNHGLLLAAKLGSRSRDQAATTKRQAQPPWPKRQ